MAGRPLKGETPRIRIVFTLDEATIDRLDAIAYADKVTRSETIDKAVARYFTERELERGEPYPSR